MNWNELLIGFVCIAIFLRCIIETSHDDLCSWKILILIFSWEDPETNLSLVKVLRKKNGMLYFLWLHAYMNVHMWASMCSNMCMTYHDWVRTQRNIKINNPLWSVVILELNKMGKLRCMWQRIYQTVDRAEINWLLSRNCVTFLHSIFIFLVVVFLCFSEQSSKLHKFSNSRFYMVKC